MVLSRKHRHNRIAIGIAAAFLGLGAMSATSYAQDSASMSNQASDVQVAARVKQALQSDSTLDARHIDVRIQHGDVVLKGFVQNNRDLLAATEAATKAAGDRKVVNNLSIMQNPPNAP